MHYSGEVLDDINDFDINSLFDDDISFIDTFDTDFDPYDDIYGEDDYDSY